MVINTFIPEAVKAQDGTKYDLVVSLKDARGRVIRYLTPEELTQEHRNAIQELFVSALQSKAEITPDFNFLKLKMVVPLAPQQAPKVIYNNSEDISSVEISGSAGAQKVDGFAKQFLGSRATIKNLGDEALILQLILTQGSFEVDGPPVPQPTLTELVAKARSMREEILKSCTQEPDPLKEIDSDLQEAEDKRDEAIAKAAIRKLECLLENLDFWGD